MRPLDAGAGHGARPANPFIPVGPRPPVMSRSTAAPRRTDDRLLHEEPLMAAIDEPLRLLVHRQNLRETCFAPDTDAHRPLAEGQADRKSVV